MLAFLGVALFATVAFAEGQRVALLPVVVHTQERPEYLQAGMGDMLASRLARTPGLELVRVADPKAATTDLDAARSAARAVGARYVVFGSFTSFGDGASLDLQCASVEGTNAEPRQVFVQSGSLASIIPKLDDLVARIAVYASAPAAPGTRTPAVSAPPAGAPSRAELDDLRRRVEILEEAGRSRGSSTSLLPAAPEAGGAQSATSGSRSSSSAR